MSRGTRRPHAKRVRAKKVNVQRRSGGGKKKGCGKAAVLILFALISLPAIIAVVAR